MRIIISRYCKLVYKQAKMFPKHGFIEAHRTARTVPKHVSTLPYARAEDTQLRSHSPPPRVWAVFSGRASSARGTAARPKVALSSWEGRQGPNAGSLALAY